MASGIEMMLKSMGVDPQKIIADFEQLKTGVASTLQQINTRLAIIEKQNEEILQWQRTQTNPQGNSPQPENQNHQQPQLVK